MKTKHKPFRIKRGFYNYRGYNIVACGPRRWTIMNDDDSVAAETKTLRAMLRKCDRWEREAIAKPKYVRLRPGQKRRPGYQYRYREGSGRWTPWLNGDYEGWTISPGTGCQYRAPRLQSNTPAEARTNG